MKKKRSEWAAAKPRIRDIGGQTALDGLEVKAAPPDAPPRERPAPARLMQAVIGRGYRYLDTGEPVPKSEWPHQKGGRY